MFSMLWQKWLNHRPQPCRRRPAASRRCRPRLEALEDRLAPALLTVNTTTDGNDPTVLSLRQAIQAVDNQSLTALSPQQQQQVSGNLGDHDQIQFAPGLTGIIFLQGGSPNWLGQGGGELDITQPVMITGPGAANLRIDALGLSRVFAVLTPGINVTLDGLTIAGGGAGPGRYTGGSGVYNVGNLTVSNCIVSDNSAGLAGSGGGIYNDYGATLTVSNSILFGNSTGNVSNPIGSDFL